MPWGLTVRIVVNDRCESVYSFFLLFVYEIPVRHQARPPGAQADQDNRFMGPLDGCGDGVAAASGKSACYTN